jgi:dienelactone hydrolase
MDRENDAVAWSRNAFWTLLKSEPQAPPAVLSREVEDRAGYSVERLLFDFGAAGPVRGILTRPTKTMGRAPALLYMHAHGGRFDIGANEILDGQPATLSPLGPVFAGQGYVTLMLEMPLFGARATITESALSKALLWRGRTVMGQMLAELTGALGYLAGRDDVDAGRVGAYGISMGCTHGFMLAALDDRIKAVAHLCCFADYGVMIDLNLHDGHGHYLTIPGMLAETSVGEIGGAIAPRPQLICIGEADTLTPPAAFAKAYDETRTAYAVAGAPSALRLFSEPGIGHAETPGMRKAVLEFFRETL